MTRILCNSYTSIFCANWCGSSWPFTSLRTWSLKLFIAMDVFLVQDLMRTPRLRDQCGPLEIWDWCLVPVNPSGLPASVILTFLKVPPSLLRHKLLHNVALLPTEVNVPAARVSWKHLEHQQQDCCPPQLTDHHRLMLKRKHGAVPRYRCVAAIRVSYFKHLMFSLFCSE